jgi:hypothetical protein
VRQIRWLLFAGVLALSGDGDDTGDANLGISRLGGFGFRLLLALATHTVDDHVAAADLYASGGDHVHRAEKHAPGLGRLRHARFFSAAQLSRYGLTGCAHMGVTFTNTRLPALPTALIA